jgi:hypothetical protein
MKKMKRRTVAQKESRDAKQSVKRAVKASGTPRVLAGGRRQDSVDNLMTASAAALGLTIERSWRDSVKFNLRLVLDHAARVETFSLPDDAEPGAVFHA